MNRRSRQRLQKLSAVALFALAMLLVALAFAPIQYPDWWPRIAFELPREYVPWWPVVRGIAPSSHYFARIFITIAFGLSIFLPQIETTFVSLMRRQSTIGAPYVDRKSFTCPTCGAVNRPSVQFCVKCGSQISSNTRYWAPQAQRTGLVSGLKAMLLIAGVFALFLGTFDPTAYVAMTGHLGTDGGTVFAAIIISSLPSIAAFAALKEGPFRRYSSLKQFDKLVFGDAIWIVSGLLLFALAATNYTGQATTLIGATVILGIQVITGAIMLLHPLLRRRVSRPFTIAYT